MNCIVNIGILGALINNDNLGCQALTYSVIDLLDEIANRNNIQFHYYIVENQPNNESTQLFCNNIGISPNAIITIKDGNFRSILRRIKHINENINVNNHLRKCKFVIDLTQGDSFTDIYGQPRFDQHTNLKLLVERYTSLILGSQTYGPFQNQSNEKKAAAVIRRAKAVFTRDNISGEYVRKITGIDPILTCDLAFRLPYKSHAGKRNGKIKRIGFNVSGLLVKDKKECTDTKFVLMANYDAFVKQVLEYLISNKYEVHLIGHVGADYTVNKILKKKYPSIILAPEFDNPMDAKSYISSMDLFIGSRMHATIAALTSNTPVVPVAYSRKFTGLFENVDYPYVVDLQTEDTNGAVQAVIDRIENYDETRNATAKSYQIAMRENDECLKLYEKVIKQIIHA